MIKNGINDNATFLITWRSFRLIVYFLKKKQEQIFGKNEWEHLLDRKFRVMWAQFKTHYYVE